MMTADSFAPVQAAAAATGDIPILGTSVTEYGVAFNIENFSGTLGTNVSGTSGAGGRVVGGVLEVIVPAVFPQLVVHGVDKALGGGVQRVMGNKLGDAHLKDLLLAGSVLGTNVSGTSDLAPLDQQAEMIKEWYPDAKTVGLLYCSAQIPSSPQKTGMFPWQMLSITDLLEAAVLSVGT